MTGLSTPPWWIRSDCCLLTYSHAIVSSGHCGSSGTYSNIVLSFEHKIHIYWHHTLGHNKNLSLFFHLFYAQRWPQVGVAGFRGWLPMCQAWLELEKQLFLFGVVFDVLEIRFFIKIIFYDFVFEWCLIKVLWDSFWKYHLVVLVELL